LARRQLALKADTAADLAQLVKKASGDPAMLDPMKRAMTAYSRPRAARDIAARVLEELYRPSFEKGRKTC
ncbi:MAG TPA: hypothetical protein DDW67_05535, partial [Elusimicrobia bacterium]|nr:hypothetical protein [Elusimicrobiota bacterium]